MQALTPVPRARSSFMFCFEAFRLAATGLGLSPEARAQCWARTT